MAENVIPVEEVQQQEGDDAPSIKAGVVRKLNSNGTPAKFQKLLNEKKPRKAAIFTHAFPDPDAISSMMGVAWLLRKTFEEIEVVCFFDGVVSHPQNIAMVNLLDPEMRSVEDYTLDGWDMRILVDTVPSHAGVGSEVGDDDKPRRRKIPFDIILDHHKEQPPPDYQGLFINLKAGSCAATVFHLIKKMGLKFEKTVDYDVKVATAIMVGIMTDTENLMSEDATGYESDAFNDLLELKNHSVLKQIVNYERPKYWVKREADAVNRAEVHEGVGVVGLGILSREHRDMISDMAQQMVSWEDVNTAVAFAIVDGHFIEGSVRSKNASTSVPILCRQLGLDKGGEGGGKLGKGAYRYDLAGAGVEEDEEEKTKDEIWELFRKRELLRIFKIIKK